MLDKILLYVDESEATKTISAWALKLARLLSARLFVVFVIRETDVKKTPSKSRAKGGSRNSNLEEKAWAILYEIEDDAFEENVKISLILEEGRPEDKLIEVLQGFGLDAMIVSSQAKLDFKELISRSQNKALIIK